MTHRERFLAGLNGLPVDRFFRYEHGPWPTTRERWLGEGYPEDVDFNDYFEMDPVVRIMINSGYTDSPYEPGFVEETIEKTDAHRIYRDVDGIIRREFIKERDTSMPQFLSFPVSSREDWEAIVERLDPADALRRIGNIDALTELTRDETVPTMLPMCGAFGHPRNLFGDELLAYILYDDPDLYREVLDNWLELYCELLTELTRTVRVDALLVWEDMCFKNGPLIGPNHVREFMLPWYQLLIDHAKSCGVDSILVDTDGDCSLLIPLFLSVGVDALMPFEVQAGMDVVQIADQYPGLGIMGGINKRALALGRDEIRHEVDRVMPAFLDRGGFIPTLDHTVPPDVPLENFVYYLECVRRYE